MTGMAVPAMSLVGRWLAGGGTPRATHTLSLMVQMVMGEYENPSLVEVAVDIVDEVEEKNPDAMAAAILRWLREHTRFVADPVNAQMLKAPLLMLELIRRDQKVGGDCVDIAMLSASLCMAVGIQCAFISEAYSGDPDDAPLVHVYTIAQTQNGWVSLDTQRGPDELTQPVRRVRTSIP